MFHLLGSSTPPSSPTSESNWETPSLELEWGSTPTSPSGASNWETPSLEWGGSSVKTTIDTPVSSIHKCGECDKSFSRKDNLYKHIRKNHGTEPELRKGEFGCDKCDEHFTEKRSLLRHVENAHGTEPVLPIGNNVCSQCSEVFSQHTDLIKHINKKHPSLPFNYIRDMCKSRYLCPTCDRPFYT